MLVGFTYRSVTIRPSTIFTVVSRNDTLSLDHSVVNLIRSTMKVDNQL